MDLFSVISEKDSYQLEENDLVQKMSVLRYYDESKIGEAKLFQIVKGKNPEVEKISLEEAMLLIKAWDDKRRKLD